MRLHPTLDALTLAHPLPNGFVLDEVFEDGASLGELRLCMVGLVAKRSSDGASAFGSAAAVGEAPWGRAYYELVERVSLRIAHARTEASFPSYDADGNACEPLPHAEVFHVAEGRDGLRPALSNGVALHTTFEEASRRARFELAERDGVLATWWGEAPVRAHPLPNVPELAALEPYYELRAALLGDGGALGLPAAGVFGFPKHPEVPMVYGFGAAAEAGNACLAAAQEMLQRLAFLWGEPIPSAPPEPEPTPDFHQEYYLVPQHHDALRAWLNGAHGGAPRGPTGDMRCELRYVDLTPEDMAAGTSVVKALSPRCRRLFFGKNPARGGRAMSGHTCVHPVI